MNWLKHILVMVALLFSAMPCVHAAGHLEHNHGDEPEVQLSEPHTCLCHHGDSHSHDDHIDVEQRTVSVSVTAAVPATVQTILFTHTESRPVIRRITSPVTTPLSALRTVQLLT